MQTIKKALNKKSILILAAVLLLALYWLRLFNLDQDLPPWGVGMYQPKDEGCYAILAINEMEYGKINPENPLMDKSVGPMYVQEHIRVNLLGNLFEMLSFRTFGDNYFGLRFPMVAIGFCNLCLMAVILLLLRRQFGKGDNKELWMILGLLLFVSVSFYYFLASRTVEPSTLRMLFAQLTFLIWLTLNKRRRLCFFLMGLCVSTSILLVYLTNAFLCLAVGILLIMIGKTEGPKHFFNGTVWFLLGFIPVFAAAELYYRMAWNSSVISNALGTLGVFKDAAGYSIEASNGVKSMAHGVIKGVMRYFSAFWFLYSPTLLFAALMLCLPSVWTVVAKKDETLCLLLAIPASLLIQTMITDDYIWRKLLVVAPFFLFLVMWWFLRREEIAGYREMWLEKCEKIHSRFIRTLTRWFVKYYTLLSVCLSILFVVFHLFLSSDSATQDLTTIDKGLILLLGCIPIIFWFLRSLRFTYRKLPVPLPVTIGLLGCSALVLNLAFMARYVVLQPTFRERDMQISLSETYHLDNKYVIGDCAMGITLYNDLKPIYDQHTNYGSRMISNPELVLFHYAVDSKGMRDYLDTTIFSQWSEYTAKQVQTIPGTFQAFGKCRDFALYEAAPRKDVISEWRNETSDELAELQDKLNELERNNNNLDNETLSEMRNSIIDQINELTGFSENEDDDRNIIKSPVYEDYYGDIYGDVWAPIYGRVFGKIYGNVWAPIYGDVFGDIYGNIYVECPGTARSTVRSCNKRV